MVTPEVRAVLLRAANNNEEAFRFLQGCFWFWHQIDDLIDGNVPYDGVKEHLIKVLAYAKDLYSCPFYQQNTLELSAAIDAITNAYADSVQWEESTEDWQQNQANILRSQGVDLVCLVAKICGGYELMREISPEIRRLSHLEQRAENLTS